MNSSGDLLNIRLRRSGKKTSTRKDSTELAIQADRFTIHFEVEGFIKVGKAKIAPGFSFKKARIGTVEGGESGILVWKWDQLVAVLTRIDEEAYSTKGKWFLETGFGLLSGQHKNFDTIEEAIRWVARHTFPDTADGSADSAAGS
ncbi:hypothetical protein NKH70_34695 [Mesorhizobium sp. M0991]|uniref:hypothetical protein n=1 Tax=Mesorhizobium sp. M0991 TaxID=2957043 RepID=UPI003339DE3F